LDNGRIVRKPRFLRSKKLRMKWATL